jgi:hypothetical protein
MDILIPSKRHENNLNTLCMSLKIEKLKGELPTGG